ncbi:hypothetical protein GMSM_17550 [Geomonas sp. Red276]
MKKLLSWGGVGLLTSALLDPVIYATLEKPVPWGRDVAMGVAGIACLYLLVKYRNQL